MIHVKLYDQVAWEMARLVFSKNEKLDAIIQNLLLLFKIKRIATAILMNTTKCNIFYH